MGNAHVTAEGGQRLYIAERASAACRQNGVGLRLLERFYLNEESWYLFTAKERDQISQVARAFADLLREAKFLPDL